MTARTVLVTGSAGLIGSETVKRFAGDGSTVVGIDNDMRKQFFGAEASTRKIRDELLASCEQEMRRILAPRADIGVAYHCRM